MASPDQHARTLNMLGALALALADRIGGAATAAAGLPENSASALVAITNHPGGTVDTLRRTLGLTHSGAVRLLDGLEAVGLVERQRSARDARAVTLWTTDAGRRRAAAIVEARARLLGPILDVVGPEQAAQLASILEAALAVLTRDPDDARSICRFCEEGVCRPVGCPVEKAASSRAR